MTGAERLDGQVCVFITHRTKPGMRDTVSDVWHTHMAPAIAAHEGHLSYCYTFDANDSDVIVAFQRYRDAAAASGFLKTPAYVAYLEAVEQYLEGPPVVVQAAPQWIKSETGEH